jgi:hypothetical protein
MSALEYYCNFQEGSWEKGGERKRGTWSENFRGEECNALHCHSPLAEILHSSDPEHVTAYLFLLLDWNLISGITSDIDLVSIWSDVLCFEI